VELVEQCRLPEATVSEPGALVGGSGPLALLDTETACDMEWNPVARPIIATKLYVPKRRRGLVARPRLRERLRRDADVRLVLVSAPAGFGKTTLLAEWFDEAFDDGPVAWISLDPSDSDPSMFWSCIVTALDGVGSLEPTVRDLLDVSPLPTELLITALVNELDASTDDVWLVLDDFHAVDNRDVVRGIATLLDRLPSHVHVVMSTRSDPDLPLPRWRSRGELVEIRAADLRFTSDETAAYLNDVAGLALDDGDVAVLEQRTEGWAAALQLAALSIRGHEDVRGFISRFAGDDRYIVDYLVDEVLERQPADVRDFLSQSSVLDRLSGPLCDAVTDRRDGREMLEALERANLFVVSLDDRREWYRYHHLFAGALRARMLSDEPGRVTVNHVRASDWYERHDQTEDAVRHAIAGADFDRAMRLIEQAIPVVRRDRDDILLIGWLRALPVEAVRRSPLLSVFYGWTLMASGDLDAVERWFDHGERLLASAPSASWPETPELRSLPATTAIFRAALAQARGDGAAATSHAWRALDLADPDDHQARGGSAGFLGLGLWIDGDVTAAAETFSHAVASIRAAGHVADDLTSTAVLADMWIAAGRSSEARRLLLDGLERSRVIAPTSRRGIADLHVSLAAIELEAGDLAAAKEHLRIATIADERVAMGENRFRLFVAMADVAAAEGDLDGAIDHLDRAEQVARPSFMPRLRPIPAVRARLSIASGSLADAEAWALATGVARIVEVDHRREFDLLTFARLLIAQHREARDGDRADDALLLLARLRVAAELSGRRRSVVETDVLTALALDAKGHRSEAVESLQRAWAEAVEPEAHARLVLDEGAPMVELLLEVTRSSSGSACAQRLLDLASRGRHVPEGMIRRPLRRSTGPVTMVDALSERELHVLRLLASDLSGPEIASELFVSIHTVRTHTKRIFTKLGVTSRRAAVSRARELGVL
jgi:LuxR family maltose regulon positive regulatory protein